MGAWLTIRQDFEDALEELNREPRIAYVGREASASPAVGYLKIHEQQQAALVANALDMRGTAESKTPTKRAPAVKKATAKQAASKTAAKKSTKKSSRKAS